MVFERMLWESDIDSHDVTVLRSRTTCPQA